ncbi:MAG: hypothetical protein AB1295_05485 [Candidatus Micrarchaeota archaeon]
MGKVKVILALGARERIDWSSLARPKINRDFFRAEGKRFIEGIIKDSGRRSPDHPVGLVLFEAAWATTTAKPSETNPQMVRALDKTLNAGLHTMDPRLDWGFNDVIVHANFENPQSIICMAEMQSKEEMERLDKLAEIERGMWKDCSTEERINIMSKRLALSMASNLERDKTVFWMIEHFRCRPEMAFRLARVFVVRGLEHKPMRMLFDQDYDVKVKEEREVHLPRFYKDALERYYLEGGMDEREIGRLARMMVAWEDIIAERRIAPDDISGRKKAEKEAGRIARKIA